MLWTDGFPVTTAQLTDFDNDAGSIAASESIDLDKISMTAYAECCSDLRSALKGISGRAVGYASDPFSAAVFNTGSFGMGSIVPHPILLNRVVSRTNPDYSELQQWYAFRVLSHLYRNGYSNGASERYQNNILINDAEVKKRWYRITEVGIPALDYPLPCPGAKFDASAGFWNNSNLSQVTQSGLTGGAFYVAVTWSTTTAVESGPSEKIAITLATNKALRVDIASLTPPTGSAPGPTRGTTTPQLAAATWSIYVGSSMDAMYRQVTGTPVATKQVTLSADPVLSGVRLGYGQLPDAYLKVMRFINRA